jgi:hypothetical protein
MTCTFTFKLLTEAERRASIRRHVLPYFSDAQLAKYAYADERKILYRNELGGRYWVWNSRLGAIPCEVRTRWFTLYRDTTRIGPREPFHVPAVGELVICDLTRERAIELATEAYVQEWERKPWYSHLHSWASREEAISELTRLQWAARDMFIDVYPCTEALRGELQRRADEFRSTDFSALLRIAEHAERELRRVA